ncbi:glycosyltransferase family 39 protein [Solidesulfovibrio sp. C21]|uniref:glycosyltransferase family 39 protein n=1 Tax=Solidesulfovibrio sp. C21 TaxID=3398613 RepID=UPI0039FCDFB1
MTTARDRGGRWIWILLGIILCLAAFIRLHALGVPELQWDERLALHRASMPVAQLWDSINNQSASDVSLDTSPPLHHLCIHFARLLGDNDFNVRLPSVLFGLASLLMLFLVGRQFFDAESGLCAALYGALLQFHVAYSRYMRWYVFFYTFSLLSLYCYRRLLDSKTWRAVLAYAVATALMLYSSYLAAPFVLAQMLFTGILCLPALTDRAARAEARKLLFAHGAGLCLAALFYLPQVKGQLVAYYTFYHSGGHAFDFYRVAKAFREITLYFRDSDFAGTGGVALFMLAGLVWRWRGKAGRNLGLFLVWCAVPTLAAFVINVQTQITAKYLVGLLYAVLLLAGAGVMTLSRAVIGQGLAPGSRAYRALTLALGLAGILFILGPNLQYAALYRSWQHNAQRWARYLLLHKQDADSVMFASNRAKKVILERELHGAYRFFGDVAGQGYRKFFYVIGKGDFVPPGLTLVEDMPQDDEVVLFFRGGVVGQAPLVASPGGADVYADDFTTLRFYETVWQAHNVAPDYQLHALSQFTLDAPGRATWKLVSAPGARCRSVAVRFDAVMRGKIRAMRPDARLRLLAGQDPDMLTLVADIDYAKFVTANSAYGQPEATGTSKLPLAATVPWPRSDQPLYVRLEFVPGHYAASIDLERLSFRVDGEAGEHPGEAALAVLGNIAAHTRLAPWKAGEQTLGGEALHVFCADDARHPQGAGPLSWQSAVERERFVTAHPGLPPVAVLRDPDGAPAFYLYDAHLADASLSLPQGREETAAVAVATPWAVRGLAYTGATSRPVVRLGGKSLPIPLSVPAGSLVELNPGGEGLVHLSPRFTPKDFNLYNMVRRDNLNILGDALTCLEGRPCLAEYVFASELPIKGVRAMIYPALRTDKPNYARVFYGINDIDARRVFLDFSERGPLDISSTYEGVLREVRFETPVHILFVGCELSGPGASIRSNAKYPMRIEVLLDAAALPSIAAEASSTTVGQRSETGEPMRLWLSGKPLPLRQVWETR